MRDSVKSFAKINTNDIPCSSLTKDPIVLSGDKNRIKKCCVYMKLLLNVHGLCVCGKYIRWYIMKNAGEGLLRFLSFVFSVHILVQSLGRIIHI